MPREGVTGSLFAEPGEGVAGSLFAKPGEGVAEALGGGLLKLFAELRGGHRDQQARALGERLAAQVDAAVLGDDVVGLEPRGHHAGSRRQHGLDLVVALGRRGEIGRASCRERV